ncbi:hypothetical protein [Flavobacterium solisilvae]|uniref:DUF4595 domain-containing protein n=1 Tax=Flavobacterium solisilvae TaxID=1852019 RepID=A0ABX1QSN2_9FLAO|nr:hypothetical protein [Flavobacterium solisilvae]NMH24881.1 hypothetical protein [Flavobacterium solisilvae]
MKYLKIIIICLLFINCSQDDRTENNINVSQIPFPEASFKITLKYDFEKFSTIHSSEYSFDANGNVSAEKYISTDNPKQSYFSTFQYDANGRIISETRNNYVVSHVIWSGNTAKVYHNTNLFPSTFVFSNGNLTEVIFQDSSASHKINYDSNSNIISEEQNNEVFVEYLNYNLSVSNPLHVLKSIAILRYDIRPFSKNIFETKKAYPYEGDDFSIPLTFYQFQYTLNQNSKVLTITDDETGIYKTFFEYY